MPNVAQSVDYSSASVVGVVQPTTMTVVPGAGIETATLVMLFVPIASN